MPRLDLYHRVRAEFSRPVRHGQQDFRRTSVPYLSHVYHRDEIIGVRRQPLFSNEDLLVVGASFGTVTGVLSTVLVIMNGLCAEHPDDRSDDVNRITNSNRAVGDAFICPPFRVQAV